MATEGIARVHCRAAVGTAVAPTRSAAGIPGTSGVRRRAGPDERGHDGGSPEGIGPPPSASTPGCDQDDFPSVTIPCPPDGRSKISTRRGHRFVTSPRLTRQIRSRTELSGPVLVRKSPSARGIPSWPAPTGHVFRTPPAGAEWGAGRLAVRTFRVSPTAAARPCAPARAARPAGGAPVGGEHLGEPAPAAPAGNRMQPRSNPRSDPRSFREIGGVSTFGHSNS